MSAAAYSSTLTTRLSPRHITYSHVLQHPSMYVTTEPPIWAQTALESVAAQRSCLDCVSESVANLHTLGFVEGGAAEGVGDEGGSGRGVGAVELHAV